MKQFRRTTGCLRRAWWRFWVIITMEMRKKVALMPVAAVSHRAVTLNAVTKEDGFTCESYESGEIV